MITNHILAVSLYNLSKYFPISDPTLIFFTVLCIILFAPIIMGKLRIPHIIGMVLAGVFIGQYGLNILARDDSFELFGKVGLYYIMFLAGLEMDMEGMKRNSARFIIFGLLTFGIPFVLTYFISQWLLGYSEIASLILGCIMGANTLIAYPVVGRYGLQRERSVSLSVGSSMIALFTALVILGAVVGSYGDGDSNTLYWVWFVLRLVLLYAALIFFIPRISRWFLRRYSDAIMQFIFILSMLFMSAAMSEAAGFEGILGAFLSGLILSRYIPRVSALMNRIEFIGNNSGTKELDNNQHYAGYDCNKNLNARESRMFKGKNRTADIFCDYSSEKWNDCGQKTHCFSCRPFACKAGKSRNKKENRNQNAGKSVN